MADLTTVVVDGVRGVNDDKKCNRLKHFLLSKISLMQTTLNVMRRESKPGKEAHTAAGAPPCARGGTD